MIDLSAVGTFLGIKGGALAGKAVTFVLGNPVASRVLAGGLLFSGLQDIKNQIQAPDALRSKGKIAGAVGKLLVGAGLVVFNDTDWYSHSGADETMVGLNFNAKRGGTPLPDGTPSISAVSLGVDLLVPNTELNEFDQMINAYWKTLRQANTGAVNYSIENLKAYIINLRALYAVYADTVRLYGLANAYNFFDVTAPRNYIAAAVGYENPNVAFDPFARYAFENQLADLRTGIFQRAQLIYNNFPGVFDWFERAAWLFSNGYLDQPSVKGIPYLMRLERAIVWDEAPGEEVSTSPTSMQYGYCLRDLSLPRDPSSLTTNAILSRLDKAIQRVLNVPNQPVIAGDILHAFGENALVCIAVPEVEYTPGFFYCEEVLTQIQNMRSLGVGAEWAGVIDPETAFLRSDTGIMSTKLGYCRPDNVGIPYAPTGWSRSIQTKVWNSGGQAPLDTISKSIVNIWKDKVSTEELLSATAMHNTAKIRQVSLALENDNTNLNYMVYLENPTHWCDTNVHTITVIGGVQFTYDSPSSARIRALEYRTVAGLVGTAPKVAGTEDIEAQLISYFNCVWSQMDWMPALTFMIPETEVNVIPSSTLIQVTFSDLRCTARLYDLNVWAEYHPESASIYDGFRTTSMLNSVMGINPKRMEFVEPKKKNNNTRAPRDRQPRKKR